MKGIKTSLQQIKRQRCKKQRFLKPGMSAAVLLLLLFAAGGTACGKEEDDSRPSAFSGGEDAGDDGAYSAEAGDGYEGNGRDEQRDPLGRAADGLKFLCDEDENASCATGEGYYYISTEEHKLQDGSRGYRLMYIDYASCTEVCLCSAPGCSHDTKDCTAVLPYDEFPAHTSKLFMHQGSLYLLSREYDSEGNYFESFQAEEGSTLGGVSSMNPMPAVLYRMNPDGTGRQKVFSFDPDMTVEGTLALDGQGLYAVSKKLSSGKVGTGEYISSSERTLVFLDLSSYDLRQISSMEFGDDISWELIGCAGGSFVLEGIDYGRKLTVEEYFGDDDIYQELYENSYTVFALLDTVAGSPKEFYRKKNEEIHSDVLLGGVLYLAFDDSKEILSVDIATGKETLLASHAQNYIRGTIGNMLCCQNMNSFLDPSYYFVNTDTGEIRQSRLVNKSLGWSLDLVAENDTDVLVIYDYDAVEKGDGSYSLRQYQYGLISKEDLISGNDNYRKIQMAGRGY